MSRVNSLLSVAHFVSSAGCVVLVLFLFSTPSLAQTRSLGLDVSAWQGNLSTSTWNSFAGSGNRDFVFIRSSRGGTTGYYNQSNADNDPPTNFLSQRYDDPYFIQNITRATTAGMFAGPYHFGRMDIIASTPYAEGIANNGTDEANHFIEMAGPWMRPGYLLPVFDHEAGISQRTPDELAQFAVDFSNRIYEVMGIRPAVYIGGNYANDLESASQSLQNQVVQAYPTLWSARWPNQDDPDSIPVQTGHPKDSYTPIYGPWDDSGPTHPWSFWQYASTGHLPGYSGNLDLDVAQGGIEFLKDKLVPALWVSDDSGDWSDLAKWNSGQTPVAPVQGPGQVARVGGLTLPTPRLPGEDDTLRSVDGQNDTVVLDRPDADITVTLSGGDHNIRKLYAREALDISGGSLTINYTPTADSTPISAQFSAAVSLGGGASLNVHTLQVDTEQSFTVSGGNLTFNRINLMPHASTPGKIVLDGDLNFNPLNDAAATITKGTGSGNGRIDLGGADRVIHVGDGAAPVDLAISVPLANGGLIKSGPGTLQLTVNSLYAGDTAVEEGTLRLNSGFLSNGADVLLNTGGLLDLNFTGSPDVVDTLFIDGEAQPIGIWGGIGSGAEHTTPLITGSGKLQVLSTIVAIAGDFDGDGDVDGDDLAQWQGDFGANGDSDADGDGDSDGRDWLIWQRNYTGPSPLTAQATAVPEAATLRLLIVALLLTLNARRP